MDIIGPFPTDRAQKKFLLAAIDYFTKWVETELLATISVARVQKFVCKIVCCFGLPRVIITNNGRQFIDMKLAEFYRNLGIKHVTSFVEHPQTNSQAEAINKTIVNELKRRLGECESTWVDELPEVLWGYRCVNTQFRLD